MDAFEERYAELTVAPGQARGGARAETDQRAAGSSAAASCSSTAPTARALAALGEVRTPSIADLFVAVIGGESQKGELAA